ncbi:MAG: antibiotic biosynthesis monooxygenase [Candidatus Dormibacteraeota bacterium]|nr:antibiotic biosynthesis monooxygenase [Candidatus Dormibacteraeota bacterium]
MIIRIWHGWTTRGDADAYQTLLHEEITPESVNGEQTPGMRGIDLLRRDLGEDSDEVEFVTVMTFEDWDAVRAFAGPEVEASVVPDADRALLKRFDASCQHYELLSAHRVEGRGAAG